MVNVGGFFAQLSLKSDQASFDKSQKDLKSVQEQVKKTGQEFGAFVGKFIDGFLKIGAGAVGAAYAVSQIQGKMAATARESGLSGVAFNNWSTAFKLVGKDASEFVSSLGDVQETLRGIKYQGTNAPGYEKLATDLALLKDKTGKGLNIADFKDLDADQFAKKLLVTVEATRAAAPGEKGYNKADYDKYRANLDQMDKIIKGSGNFMLSLQAKGFTVPTVLAEAQKAAPLTESQMRDAVMNETSFDAFGVRIASLFAELGNTIGTSIRPFIEDLVAFIDKNRDKISAFFDNLGKVISAMLEKVGPALEAFAKSVDSFVRGIAQQSEYQQIFEKDKGGLDKIISKSKEKGVDLGNLQSNFGQIGGLIGNLTEGRNTLAAQRQIAIEAYKIANQQGYGKSLAASVTGEDVVASLSRANLMMQKATEKLFLEKGQLGTYSGGTIKDGKVTGQTFNVTFNNEQTKEVVGLMKQQGLSLGDAINAVALTK